MSPAAWCGSNRAMSIIMLSPCSSASRRSSRGICSEAHADEQLAGTVAVTFLPIIGALFVLVVRGEDRVAVQNMRFTALFTTLITFFISLSLWVDFDRSQAGFQFLELHSWLGNFATYRLGVDGI